MPPLAALSWPQTLTHPCFSWGPSASLELCAGRTNSPREALQELAFLLEGSCRVLGRGGCIHGCLEEAEWGGDGIARQGGGGRALARWGALLSSARGSKKGQPLVQDHTAIWGKARTSTQMRLTRMLCSSAILGRSGESWGEEVGLCCPLDARPSTHSMGGPPFTGKEGSRLAEPWLGEACLCLFDALLCGPPGECLSHR